MNTPVSLLDWAIIAIYLIAVVGLGVAAGFLRRKGERGGEGGHYFLAGNTLAWPVIGLAMFAANISTVHLVSRRGGLQVRPRVWHLKPALNQPLRHPTP